MLEGNPGWMSDFLEEMGLPANAVFQGYVLYHRESDSFVADAPDPSRPHYVKPSAWARRCLLYTSPSPRDATLSRMPSSA